MIQRGRKSVASLATISKITDARPPVPEGMPEVQAKIWRATVNRLPYDYFQAEHLPLLKAYVQHVAIGEQLARQIAKFEGTWLTMADGLEHFDRLTRCLEREHRMAVSLARSLRLTHQSRYDRTVAGKVTRPGLDRMPWEPIR